MKLSKPDPTLPVLDFDPAIFFDKQAVPGSETLASELLQTLRDNGIKAHSEQETALMTALLPLIVKRDDAVFNYAYKAGRTSVTEHKSTSDNVDRAFNPLINRTINPLIKPTPEQRFKQELRDNNYLYHENQNPYYQWGGLTLNQKEFEAIIDQEWQDDIDAIEAMAERSM